MQSAALQTNGIAVKCDNEGIITEIIRDRLQMTDNATVGKSFFALIDPDCYNKTKAFLSALNEQKAAFNWELNVIGESGKVESLHFAGSAVENGFIIVGAKSRTSIARIYDEMVQINNEQTNSLRSALKDLSLQIRTQSDRDNFHYDELTKLNNELGTLQRELAKKNVELARINEQKNQFLGIAAHDLRNPLEVILSYSRFLLEDAADSLKEEQVEFINIIRSSSEFMLNLVNDFLDYSKIDAGRLDLNLEFRDLTEVVSRAVTLNQVLAEQKNQLIKFAPNEAKLPLMKFDAAKIEQVLNNLIGNAIKFSPQNAEIDVGLDRLGAYALIIVRDYGAGISPEDAERLFNPFVKGRTQATGGEKSTGLGLAIVKKIVEGHGGKISVCGAEKAGTKFEVTLPLFYSPKEQGGN